MRNVLSLGVALTVLAGATATGMVAGGKVSALKSDGVAWANQNASKKLVNGSASAASKGVGQVQSSAGWSGSKSQAEGSEGSITNSKFLANEDSWAHTWAMQKNGKANSNWTNDFGIKNKVAAQSKSAHQGSGASGTSATAKTATGMAQGTEGSAVDNSFKKDASSWGNAHAAYAKGSTKSAFGTSFTDKQKGASTSRAIGYGASSANAKSTINKSMVEAEGQIGAQASTSTKFSQNTASKNWGKENKGKKATSFQNNFGTKMALKGSTSGFGVGDAAVKGMTSSTSGSKAVAKGQSGSGSNADFKGDKNTWTDAWSNAKGIKVKIAPIVLEKPTKIGAAPAAPAAPIAPGAPIAVKPATVGSAAPEAAVEQAPAEQAPVEEVPAEQVPAEQAPVEEVPAEQAPVEEVPAEQAAVEQAPVEEVPVEEVPAEQAPADQAAEPVEVGSPQQ